MLQIGQHLRSISGPLAITPQRVIFRIFLGSLDRGKIEDKIERHLPKPMNQFFDGARQLGWNGTRWRLLDWE